MLQYKIIEITAAVRGKRKGFAYDRFTAEMFSTRGQILLDFSQFVHYA